MNIIILFFLAILNIFHVIGYDLSGADAILDVIISTDGDYINARIDTSVSKNLTTSNSKIILSYVNGIYHTLEDWDRISKQLKEIFRCDIYPFYNPSSGSWLNDISNAGYALIRRPTDFSIAQNLAAHLKRLLSQSGENGRVLHLAHSGYA